MKKITIDKMPGVPDASILGFLSEAVLALEGFKEAYNYLSGDINEGYDESMAALGVSLEDNIMYRLDDMIGSLKMDMLNDSHEYGWFTRSLTSVKIGKAIIIMGSIQADVVTRVATVNPMSVEDARDLQYNIGFALGDFAYALVELFHVLEIAQAHTDREEISYDSIFKTYCAMRSITIEDICVNLIRIRAAFPTTIPVFEACPREWLNICKVLDPSTIETLVDLGAYIYPIDMVAFKRGELLLGEEYMSILEDRQERIESLPATCPDMWAAFQRKVPEEFASFIIKAEPYLTEGLIYPVVHGAPFDASYIAMLNKVVNGETPQASDKTGLFQ